MPLEILTSFHPNPARIERQRVCLSSWLRFGWHVVGIQGPGEAALLEELGPSIEWIEVPSAPPLLSDIWPIAKSRSGHVLLLNSDLELTGKLRGLRDLEAERERLGDGLICLRRWNHRPGEARTFGMAEQWGIDAFVFRPNGFAPFEGMPFAIGRPVWDWWLPLAYGRAGFPVWEMRDCHLLHEIHPLQWDKATWRDNIRVALGPQHAAKLADPRYLQSCAEQLTAELKKILQPFRGKAA